MEREKFEKIAEHIDDHMECRQELPDMRADLDTYCEKIQGEKKAAEDLKQIFEATEHDNFIKDICNYLILNGEHKRNSVLIHGAPNGGKTQFLNRLSEIFDCT